MIEIVNQAELRHDSLVVLDKQDNVWLTFSQSPFAILSWIRWWLMPGKKSWIFLNVKEGRGSLPTKVRVRAVRISRSYVRIG